MKAEAGRRPIAGERPLNPAARAALVVAAATTILLFYLAAITTLGLLGVAIVILLVVMIGAARVGLSSYVAGMMKVPTEIFGVLARNLWLPTPPVYRLALQRTDAPALFQIVGELAERIGVAPAREIFIEMNCSAWVMLDGFGRGWGRSRLGIGYDLLAGLTTHEVEAVIAHELAHARLVQRGFSRWLNRGLARLGRTAAELSARAAIRREAKQSPALVNAVLRVFDPLAIRATRLVASYSRQDEFEADRGAAECSGAAGLRSSLMKLERLDREVERMPWSERLARMQPEDRFSSWLVTEISRLMATVDETIVGHDVDPYSTHPSLADRLAALPADGRPVAAGGPGLELLAEPDAVAARLAVEIQRVVYEQEQRNTKKLARETRKVTRGKRREWRLYAALLGLYAVAAGIAATEKATFPLVGTSAAALFGAAYLVYRATYRERIPLPIPAYGTLTHRRLPETSAQLSAAEKVVEAELERAAVGIPKGRDRHDQLIDACYAALGDRDYLRAHVAARLAIGINQRSVSAAIGYAVAAAGLGDAEQARRMLAFVRNEAGFCTPALQWGAAWALTLIEDWHAEGLLQRLHETEPTVATYALLLALAQLYRNKLQSAMRNATTGCTLDQRNAAATQLLAHVYLLAGRARNAEARMRTIEPVAKTEPEAAFLMARIKLMKGDEAAAVQWAETLEALDGDGRSQIALGQAFSSARSHDRAAAYFTAALAAGYAPEANYGLASVAIARGDTDLARQHLLAALKLRNAKLTDGQSRGVLLHAILDRLNALDERRLNCRAWVAAFPAESAAVLAGISVVVYARSAAEARQRLAAIVEAMQENDAPFDVRTIRWKDAARELQPMRPVLPGVQFVLS
jgi:Zn-dependent protease with chaperone function/tetratricopeptide (TPR) repeat protein